MARPDIVAQNRPGFVRLQHLRLGQHNKGLIRTG